MQELKVQYNQKELSGEEQQFNLLLERIEKLTAAIEERKLMNNQFNESRNNELIPIIRRIKDLKIRQVNVLDHLFNTRDFSKAEFKKIIWPDKQTLTKQTIAVLACSVAIGALIAVLDLIIKFGLNIII